MNAINAQQPTWDAVDRALEQWLAPQDEALRAATASADHEGLPQIAVSPAQGRLLEVLALAIGARRILEIGTLAGFSTIWLARGLVAGGSLVTLELDPERARLARTNIDRAKLTAKVEVMVGPALASLESLRSAATPPFDLIFIDADKENCPAYLDHAIALSREGTLIVVDNVIRRGRLIETDTGDASVEGVRAMMDRIAKDPRLAAAGIQTVGAKGYDGMVLALVGDAPRAAGEPLEILLRHDAWATRAVLQACAALGDDQWHRRFEMGPGSLHDTLTHVVGAMFRWADRIDGPTTELRPSIEGVARRTPAELLALLDAAESGLAASADRARARGLGTEFEVTLAGKTHRFTLGAALVHVTTHGMHHRAQCLNMLRHLGAPGISDRLPEIDPLDWQLQAEA
jgi:caffeoyl-CoA O-methyltransferase